MNVPIVILNFNRAEPLMVQVEWCLQLDGAGTVHIVDSGSTWGPTLDAYATLEGLYPERVRVWRTGTNAGRGGAREFVIEHGFAGSGPVVFSEPDLVPYESTPRDLLRVLGELLDAHPTIPKAGPSLEIDDVPEYYFNKIWIEFWERRFWDEHRLTACGRGFLAAIDGTFAMYRRAEDFLVCGTDAIRTRRPWTLRHVDWYFDPDNPDPETANYLATAAVAMTRRDPLAGGGARLWRLYKQNPAAYRAMLNRVQTTGNADEFWNSLL